MSDGRLLVVWHSNCGRSQQMVDALLEWAEIIVDEKVPTVTIIREFDASCEKVFRAPTDSVADPKQ